MFFIFTNDQSVLVGCQSDLKITQGLMSFKIIPYIYTEILLLEV